MNKHLDQLNADWEVKILCLDNIICDIYLSDMALK